MQRVDAVFLETGRSNQNVRLIHGRLMFQEIFVNRDRLTLVSNNQADKKMAPLR